MCVLALWSPMQCSVGADYLSRKLLITGWRYAQNSVFGNVAQSPNDNRRRNRSAGDIDRACRLGQDVLVGDERIAGAVSCRNVDGLPVQAAPGFIWVDVLPNYEWRQVQAADVTVHPLKGASVLENVTNLNKRRGRPAKNLGSGSAPNGDSKLIDQEPSGQKRLDGMERVADPELEEQAWAVHSLQTKRMKAGEKEKEERTKLTDYMVAKNIDNYPLDDEYEVVLKKSAKAYVRKRRKTEPDDE